MKPCGQNASQRSAGVARILLLLFYNEQFIEMHQNTLTCMQYSSILAASESCEPLIIPSTLSLGAAVVSASNLYKRYELRCANNLATILPSTAPLTVTCYPDGMWDYGKAFMTDRFPGCGGMRFLGVAAHLIYFLNLPMLSWKTNTLVR